MQRHDLDDRELSDRVRPRGQELPLTQEAKPSFYVPELDGLRFFAFLAVFAHHGLSWEGKVWEAIVPNPTLASWAATAARAGDVGVDLFFVLSAYLITELLVREIDRRGKVAIFPFYVRRVLRIWPLYFPFLGLMIAVLIAHGQIDEALTYGLPFALFVGNWSCVIHGMPDSPIFPLWSISIEEQFYLLWPVLLVITKGRRTLVAIAMLVIAAIARVVFVQIGATQTAIWCATPTRLDPIALGILAVPIVRHLRGKMPTFTRAPLIAFGVAMLLVIARIIPRDAADARVFVSYPLNAIACAVIVIATAATTSGTGLLASRLVVHLGRISYGLYVFHALFLLLAKETAPTHRFLGAAVALAIDIVIASASYRVIEQPFLRLKTRFSGDR